MLLTNTLEFGVGFDPLFHSSSRGQQHFSRAESSPLQTAIAISVPPLKRSVLMQGGVTVSYFEWLKNLNHVRFGRMSRRMEEHSKQVLVAAIESEFGNGKKLTEITRKLITKG